MPKKSTFTIKPVPIADQVKMALQADGAPDPVFIKLGTLHAEMTFDPTRKINQMFMSEEILTVHAGDYKMRDVGSVRLTVTGGLLISVSEYQYYVTLQSLWQAVAAKVAEDGRPSKPIVKKSKVKLNAAE